MAFRHAVQKNALIHALCQIPSANEHLPREPAAPAVDQESAVDGRRDLRPAAGRHSGAGPAVGIASAVGSRDEDSNASTGRSTRAPVAVGASQRLAGDVFREGHVLDVRLARQLRR